MLALNPTQLANASHSIGILDQAGIPYALAIGNHDYDKLPPVNRSAITFNQYFGPSRYANAGHYGATNFPAGSNENFYETFNWGGKATWSSCWSLCRETRRWPGQVRPECQY